MAGAKDHIFKEKLTPFIKEQLFNLVEKYGENSKEYLSIASQYLINPSENEKFLFERERHYDSEIIDFYNEQALRGVERLYKRTILIEPSSVCAAHCRWCLRGQYPIFSLRDEEIVNFAKYCGSEGLKDEIKEILITGGDPFMVPQKLNLIISSVKKYAANVKIIRIGTRVPLHDPSRVNNELIDILKSAEPCNVEIGTHINSPFELASDSRHAFKKLQEVVSKIYDQTVLLKGVNDSVDILSFLYDELRYLGIEAHYLFHCIPMKGMHHHRTTVQKGIELISELTSSGVFSGRSKPMFTLMTDVGKVTLYEGSILDQNINNELLVQTKYKIAEFINRNPSWKIPLNAFEDENGYLRVWYLDGGEK